MDINFWNERWEKNEIAFHMKEINPMIVNHFNELNLSKGKRIFVPLCGKTLDIKWLLLNEYHIVGIELNKKAIDSLFIDLNIIPTISKYKNFLSYSANNINIFVGDFFELTKELIGYIDAIYDRAALVALPEDMRLNYVSHLLDITNAAPQLLISYDYDQNIMEGPPFSVPYHEIQLHYLEYYEITLLNENINIPSGLKRKSQAKETIWLLKNS